MKRPGGTKWGQKIINPGKKLCVPGAGKGFVG